MSSFFISSAKAITLFLTLSLIPGGLFDISDTSLGAEVTPEAVFRRCVETVNIQGLLGNSTLSTQIERVPATDPFHTAKRGEQDYCYDSSWD